MLAACEDKLPALFDEHRNERILHIMSLECKMHLECRKNGRLARYVNHSCYPNLYVKKWTVQG